MLTGKERIMRIMDGKDTDRNGFWLGNPHPDALKKYKEYFNVGSHRELLLKLNSDLIWSQAEWGMLNPLLFMPYGLKRRKTLSEGGLLKDAETIEEVENIYWCRRKKFLFPFMDRKLKFAERNGLAVFSGLGTYFWHNLLDYFGMEECFVKMYTHPEVVTAAVNKIVDIYLRANGSFYEKFAERIDAVFFFNDLGTQLDTLVSPDLFREYFLPGAKKLVDQAKSFGIKVALHSCGSIERFIPDIINLGVDVLHPIQANARNMQAELLQERYGGKIVFMGGLDTQDILPFKSAGEVRVETRRLIDVFGNRFILSPSHEALLPNVPGENVLAMAEEAIRIIKP